jgi:hypothetical protein
MSGNILPINLSNRSLPECKLRNSHTHPSSLATQYEGDITPQSISLAEGVINRSIGVLFLLLD